MFQLFDDWFADSCSPYDSINTGYSRGPDRLAGTFIREGLSKIFTTDF
jgi:hypothetical protein